MYTSTAAEDIISAELLLFIDSTDYVYDILGPMAEHRHHLHSPLAELLKEHADPMSQVEMAELCMTTQQRVSRWVAGTSRIPDWALALIEHAHGFARSHREALFPMYEERLERARYLYKSAREKTRRLIAQGQDWVEHMALQIEEEQQAWLLVLQLEEEGNLRAGLYAKLRGRGQESNGEGGAQTPSEPLCECSASDDAESVETGDGCEDLD